MVLEKYWTDLSNPMYQRANFAKPVRDLKEIHEEQLPMEILRA